MPRLLAGNAPGTFFVPSGLKMEARKRWLAHFQRPKGTVSVNANAARALLEDGRSLLAVGITGYEGRFAAGEVVNIVDPKGVVIARGKCTFASEEIASIAGQKSEVVAKLFPDHKRHEVVHRNDLVVV